MQCGATFDRTSFKILFLLCAAPFTSTDDQVRTLAERLRAKGCKFSGTFPTPREIASEKAKKDRERDLEDIDASLILDDSARRFRRSVKAEAPPKKQQSDAGSGSDSEASFDC